MKCPVATDETSLVQQICIPGLVKHIDPILQTLKILVECGLWISEVMLHLLTDSGLWGLRGLFCAGSKSQARVLTARSCQVCDLIGPSVDTGLGQLFE